MIFLHIIKLLFFNYGFSFIAGLITIIPALVMSAFIKNENEPGKIIELIGGLMAFSIVAAQSLIISRATEFSLQADPSRFSFLWYAIGFMFCTPMALTRKGNQNEYTWILILGSYLIYLIGIFTNLDNLDFIESFAKIITTK